MEIEKQSYLDSVRTIGRELALLVEVKGRKPEEVFDRKTTNRLTALIVRAAKEGEWKAVKEAFDIINTYAPGAIEKYGFFGRSVFVFTQLKDEVSKSPSISNEACDVFIQLVRSGAKHAATTGNAEMLKAAFSTYIHEHNLKKFESMDLDSVTFIREVSRGFGEAEKKYILTECVKCGLSPESIAMKGEMEEKDKLKKIPKRTVA